MGPHEWLVKAMDTSWTADFVFYVCNYSVAAIVHGAHSLSWPRTMVPSSPPPPPMWF
jgi:hypothetical protein